MRTKLIVVLEFGIFSLVYRNIFLPDKSVQLQDGKHGVQNTFHARHTLEAAEAPLLLAL